MKAPLPRARSRVWMGALGLQAPGGRPQGRGCFLLAVAGATSLVTLLLAVPVTVLAVLALVPQEQGGWVTEAPGPGAQAQQGLGKRALLAERPAAAPAAPTASPRGNRPPPWALPPSPGRGRERAGAAPPPVVPSSAVPGPRELREEAPETDPRALLPAAHLIGAWTKGQGLGWEAHKEEAFLRSGARFSRAEGLAPPRDGLYFLYCHVGYRGRAPPAGRAAPGPALTLRSSLLRAGGAYGPGAPELLLEAAETVSPAAERAGRPEAGPLWYASVGLGGLVQLRRGERVYVNISHPELVDYRRGKTFFGAVMVG